MFLGGFACSHWDPNNPNHSLTHGELEFSVLGADSSKMALGYISSAQLGTELGSFAVIAVGCL